MWKPVYSSTLPYGDRPVYQLSYSHNQQTTTFRHPVTGEISPENAEFDLRDRDSSIMSPQQMSHRPYSMVSEGSTAVTTSTADSRPPPKTSKSVGKVYSFGKRDHSIKRNPSVPVLARGWLSKQDSSGMKLWKRRWFLLSDHCLFYYKDSREEAVLGSIPLLSYVISPTGAEDRITRKFSFKAVHTGLRAYIKRTDSFQDHPSMRTYYFSADTQEDMNGWIRVMNQAALVQNPPDSRREMDMEWLPAPVNNHIQGIQTRSGYQKLDEPRRNSAEEDMGDRGRYKDPADKERYKDPADKERYKDPADKERYRDVTAADKERYRDVTAGDKERYRDVTAADKERYRDVTAGDKERYRDVTAGDKERYRDVTAGDKERYRDVTAGDKERYRDVTAGDKERYRDVTAGDKERYRDVTAGDKERYRDVTAGDKERYRDVTAGDKERYRDVTAGDKERYRDVTAGDKERYRDVTAGDKERYRDVTAGDKERYRDVTAGDKERYRDVTAGDKERYRDVTAGDKERYRDVTAGDKERYRDVTAGDKERYRDVTAGDKERYRDVTAGDKERYRDVTAGDKERYRDVTAGDKERYRDVTAGDKERYRDVTAGDKERYREVGSNERQRSMGQDLLERERYQERYQESYVTHKNTLNSNGGKFTPSLLSNGRPSAFTDFSKSYRPQGTQISQPQIIERNGTLPPSFRVSTGPLEQNGIDTYNRRPLASAHPEKQVQRKSMMGPVEQWVKVQKGEGKSVGSEHPLILTDRYQTLPKTSRHPSSASPPPGRNLPSDYKYAQDRVSHLKMSNQERKATKEGTVWQLYEWQQRQQFKHGSPTGQIYMGTLEDRARAKSLLDVPRSVSVPPSPSDIPPAAPSKVFPPRRPHTPSERLTVRPEEGSADIPYMGSPQKSRVHAVKSSAHMDRRSMPSMGYMTHTADDTYIQLKKELEYLDLKIKYNEPLINLVHSVLRNSTPGYRTSINVTGRESFKDRSTKPVRIAESDVDVKLSVLCEQDRILQDLEDKIRALKDNKDKLETVLEVLHRQMDQYKDQPQHTEKISYQQRLLQEDLVQIRAEMSKVSTDMENSWNEYLRLESDVSQLRQVLQEQMTRSPSSQNRTQLQKDLWRIEDVTAGLSSNKLNFKMLVESLKNPERKTVPLVTSTFVPSVTTAFTSVRSKSASPQSPPALVKPTLEVGLYPQPYIQGRSHSQPQLLQSPTSAATPPKTEESAPPRPPLPDMYSPEDPAPNIPPPPALPPPPRESSVIRHTSVRGLKRQSDERKRDRELGQGVNGDYRVELRTYVSDPELANLGDINPSTSAFLGSDSGCQTLPTRGLSGSTSRLPQSSSVASYVTLRRGPAADAAKDRPKSAFERLYTGDNQRGKMSAEEQLQRMKRHQKALVRERKRTLSQGDKQGAPGRAASRPLSADLSSWRREQEFDFQLLEKAARDVEEREKEDHDWVHAKAVHVTELDLEPQDYDLDISRELSMPDKVEIPERYIEHDPEEPLSREELEARYRRVQKIKNILARSSVHNLQPAGPPEDLDPSDLNIQMRQQEKVITMSYALASEASQRSKQVAVGLLVRQCRSPRSPAPHLRNVTSSTIV
ncbi:pleckstrin homology domain-containing family A member 7 isoform X3 [Engystomops pustulosus]|uniref:pleckstrin homology domain-containing family A member 7 isoform X3 n=1 Tax=Engystomops pustulosus TaxID=76066 RepID=UPI003AFB41D4